MKGKFFIVVLLTMFSLKNAYAYLDPGTGSVIIQSIIASVAGALYVGKIYWIRIRLFLSKVFKNKQR
jgi:hypothetical protein